MRKLIFTKSLMRNLILFEMYVNLESKTSEQKKGSEKERDERLRDEYHEQDGNCAENVSNGEEFRELIFIIDEIEMQNN